MSSALSPSTRLKNWNTIPMCWPRRRAIASAPSRVTSTPSMCTDPESTRSSPAAMLRNVDFPHPDGPVIATNSPASMTTSTPRSARTGAVAASNVRRTSRAASTGTGSSPFPCSGARPDVALMPWSIRPERQIASPPLPGPTRRSGDVDRVLHARHEVRRALLATALRQEADEEVRARVEVDSDVVGRAGTAEGDAGERPSSTSPPPRGGRAVRRAVR